MTSTPRFRGSGVLGAAGVRALNRIASAAVLTGSRVRHGGNNTVEQYRRKLRHIVSQKPYPWQTDITFGLEDAKKNSVDATKRDLKVHNGACRRGGGSATVRPLGPGTDSDVWCAVSPTTVTFSADDGSGQWVVGKWTEADGLTILATPQVNAPSPTDGAGGLYFPIALISFADNEFALLHYAVGGVKELAIFGPATA